MDGMRGYLLDPSEDLVRQGAAAVGQRAGMSSTTVMNMARQLCREEGYGQSPGEVYAAVQEVANLADDTGHAYSLSDRRWDADQEAARLGRLASRISGGHRRG
jgi:hypothetical protein